MHFVQVGDAAGASSKSNPQHDQSEQRNHKDPAHHAVFFCAFAAFNLTLVENNMSYPTLRVYFSNEASLAVQQQTVEEIRSMPYMHFSGARYRVGIGISS